MASRRLRIAVAVGLLAGPVAWTAPSRAANVTWDGSDSTAWNTGANWTLNAAPAAGDFLFFTSGNPTNQPSNNDASGLTLSGLTFLDSTFTGPLSLGGNAVTLSATTTAGASFSRSASTTVTVTQANHGLVTGQYVTLATGSSNFNTTAQVTVLTGSTFTYTSSSNTAATITGTYTPATLNNLNTTAGRDVTIANNMVLSSAQVWAAVNDSDAVTVVSGNLSGSGDLTIGAGYQSNGTSLPNLRLTGANSGYTGTITPTSPAGLLLGSASAMTGGLIDLDNGNRNLWLTGGAASGTYAFGIGGTEVSGGRVLFRNAGTAGLYLTGGDVSWNPGGGTNYVWSGTGSNWTTINFNGTNDSTLRTLYLGNADGSFIISGASKTFRNGTGGNYSGRVTLLSALSDGNEGTARTLTTDLPLLTLTKAAVNQSATNRLGLTVSGGATTITNTDQLPGGNLSLSGGALVLDNISWSQFLTARPQGTGNGQFQFSGGGFAARSAPLVIDSGTFGTANFSLGASTAAADGSPYANQPVTLSANIALTANRTITARGNNVESYVNWTVTGPVHEVSGAISGAFTLTIDGVSTNGGGTLRLSNTSNSFANLNVGSTGAGGALALLATDDAVLGAGSVTVNAGAQGKAALLLFENQAAGQKTFSRNFTVAMGTDASAGDQGFGSYGGDVKYSGTATITGSRTTLPVQVISGTLRFGAGSAIVNNSTGGAQIYFKGGAGEMVIDQNVQYLGTGTNTRWVLAMGKITTTDLTKMTSGTTTFNAGNLLDQVNYASTNYVSATSSLRTWQVATTGTLVSESFAYIRSIMEVPTGVAFTLDTGTAGASPSESFGSGNTSTRSNLVKAGGGDWVFTNSKRSKSSSGPTNGAGFIQVAEGTLDITGDYGRGSLSVAGGTLLSGTYSPFTYSTASGTFAVGVSQENLLEVTSAGGTIGISPSAGGDVTRTVGFSWDQSGTSTLTLAARQNLNLVFSGTSATGFPDATAANTLLIERVGTGSGIVQINDRSVTTGRLGGAAQLKMGATGSGTITTLGGFHATNNTLGIRGSLVYDSSESSSFVGLLTDPTTGSNTLTKRGSGTLVIEGTQSYSGKTTIADGTLVAASILSVGGGASSLGAPATVANGTIDLGSGSTSGILRYTGGGITTDRVFNLAGGGGIISDGSGPLVLSNGITDSGTGSRVFVLGGTSAGTNQVPTIPGEVVSVTKTGAGTWRLGGASSYSGRLTVLDGTFLTAWAENGNNTPFGSNANADFLPLIGNSAAGATGTASLLIESGSVSRGIFVAESNGSQVVVLGVSGTGTTVFNTSAIRLGRSVTLQASTGGTVVFNSDWRDFNEGTSPAVAFNVGSADNAGTVVFKSSVPNSITGVNVRRGTLRLDFKDPFGATLGYGTPVTLGESGTGGTLVVNGIDQPLGSLSFTGVGSTASSMGGGTLRLFNGGTAAAAVNVTGTGHLISAPVALDGSTSFNVNPGGRLLVSSAISGSSGWAITKSGAGILELSGPNTYSGNTTVSAGTLVVNGSLGGGNLSVAAAAMLMGSGTIGGAATIAGIHSPGNSPGIETFASDLTYSSGSSQVVWELWGNTTSNSPLVYDQIIVGGTLNFADPTSVTLDFGGTGVGSVDWDDAFWATNQSWTLFDVAGTTTTFGNFSLTNSPSSWFDAGGQAFADSSRSANSFSVTQSGSDVLIQYTVVVPEPGSLALAGLGIAALAWAARHRRTVVGR